MAKTAKIKLEFEDQEVPRGVIAQAIQLGLINQGIINEGEEPRLEVTLEKLGQTEEGRFLAYAHVTIPDGNDSHFKDFYGLKDEDYLEKRESVMERLSR